MPCGRDSAGSASRSDEAPLVCVGTGRYLGAMSVTELRIRTSTQREMIDLTARLAEIVGQSGVTDGLCNVYVPHATAAIVVNENDDPNVCVDVLDALDRL